MSEAPSRQRARYRRLRDEGRCVRCGARSVRCVYCATCAVYMAEKSKVRRDHLIQAGLCAKCGAAPATRGPKGGRTLCDNCRARTRKATVVG